LTDAASRSHKGDTMGKKKCETCKKLRASVRARVYAYGDTYHRCDACHRSVVQFHKRVREVFRAW
jgi:hypothetical protein